jgi:tRNA G18 (ribose-2'-O)-methylase SpoU
MLQKQALYVLEMLFRKGYGAGWVSTFLQLYTGLDDASLHLYSSCFGQMSYAMAHPDIPVRLKSLLWRMALLHRQSTAQKESVVAFLSSGWDQSPALIKFMLEEDAFLETGLIPVLSQDKIYRGKHGDEIEGLVDVFYGTAVRAGVDVGRMVGSLLGLMAEAPRPGVLMTCARAVIRLCSSAGDDWLVSSGGTEREELRRRIVGAAKVLRNACFGSNHGVVQCHKAMMCVGAVAFRGDICEEMLGYFGEVPRALVVSGGSLHEVAKAAVRSAGPGELRYLWKYPAATWLVIYLRDDERILDGFVGTLGDWEDVFARADVLLPCLQLLTTASVRESALAQIVSRLGLIMSFQATAREYADRAIPGIEELDRLIAEARLNIAAGTRGEFVDTLEPFFSDATIVAREQLATEWECIVMVCRLVNDAAGPGGKTDLEAALIDAQARVEDSMDQLIGGSTMKRITGRVEWHVLVEIVLIDMRILAQIGTSLRALGTVVPSKSIQYQESVAKLMGRGPDSLDRSLRGWFDFTVWKAIGAFAIPIEDGSAAKVAALAADALSRSKDGDRSVIPMIRCMRILMPLLVANGRTEDVKCICEALMRIAKSHTRRRLGTTSAILTTVVHPCFFTPATLPPMRDLVHGFCLQLIEVGRRYTRLFVSMSCHLASILREAPGEQRLQYVDVLSELLMCGFDSEEQALDLRSETLDDPTREEMEFVLSAVPREISRAYRLSECAPRIASLCLLHEWVNESKADGDACRDDAAATEVCRLLWNRMYNLARADKILSKGTYMHGGPVHKRKLRLWQALATLCPIIPNGDVDATMATIMEDLSSHNHASIKYYQELIGLSLVLRNPLLLETRVFPSLADYSSQRRDDLASLFCIVAVALDNLEESNEPFYQRFVDASIEHILPWTGAFPHSARSFGQVILSDILRRTDGSDRNLTRLQAFFLSNKDLKKMLLAMGIEDGILPRVRLAKALHPTGLVKAEGYTLISRDFEPRTSKYKNVENTPMSLVERMVEFLHERRAETRAIRNDLLSKVRDRDVLGANFGRNSDEVAENDNADRQSAEQFWQRKITYDWTGALGLDIIGAPGSSADDVPIDTLERALANVDVYEPTADVNPTQASTTNDERSIIVVASFIDKIPNLAGLCRTCEIFQAKALVVSDASVTEHPEFGTISVSASSWTPIEEVNCDDVREWLQTMKRDGGWSLVGLEQTDESVSLPSFSWPRKTILILGAEKEGIPMDVLRLLDATVEIPQLGVIRSLNVHVSGALAIYSFTQGAIMA